MNTEYIKKESYHGKLISNNKRILLALLFGLLALLLILMLLINGWFFHLKFFNGLIWFPFLVLISPAISAIITLAVNGKLNGKAWSEISNIKYFRPFRTLFFYDPIPYNFRMVENEKIKKVLKEGDIVLRRHDTYIDGIVLTQNSYFTHIAIVFEITECSTTLVHCLGKGGVQYIPLENFIKCDDILVLRLSQSRVLSESNNEPIGKVNFKSKTISPVDFQKKSYIKRNLILPDPEAIWEKDDIEIEEVKGFVAKKGNQILSPELVQREQEIFELMVNRRPVNTDTYIKLVKEIARENVKQKIQYDFNFNFVDFTTMSCIEFVWFCYKSAFPLHLIGRKNHKYFHFINCVVLEPDAFLESKAFDVVYTSLGPGTEEERFYGDEKMNDQKRQELIKFCKKKHLKFYRFFLIFVMTEILLLVAIWLIWFLVRDNLAKHGYIS